MAEFVNCPKCNFARAEYRDDGFGKKYLACPICGYDSRKSSKRE